PLETKAPSRGLLTPKNFIRRMLPKKPPVQNWRRRRILSRVRRRLAVSLAVVRGGRGVWRSGVANKCFITEQPPKLAQFLNGHLGLWRPFWPPGRARDRNGHRGRTPPVDSIKEDFDSLQVPGGGLVNQPAGYPLGVRAG